MGDEQKSATAAPKKRAKAKITVVAEDGKTPIPKAQVEIWSQGSGTTDAKGKWTSHVFFEGTYDLKVFAPGYGPPDFSPRREWTSIQSVEFPAATAKKPHTEVTVTLAQALPRAKVSVVDAAHANAPVHGALVRVAGHEGRTDAKGEYLSPAFALGTHDVAASKFGHAPPGTTSEGAHTISVEFANPEDKPVSVELSKLWGKVRSSNITVNEAGSPMHFVDWFNKIFRKKAPSKFPKDPTKLTFPGTVPKGTFNNVFDNVAKLYAPELTVEEFVAIFMIIYNETGASFTSIAEKGTPKRFFDAIKGDKVSYNQAGNRKAGDLLKERGVLTAPEDIALWNGVVWPDPAPGSDLYNAALECDFNKFRGRGLLQITFRSAYLKYVDPALAAAGLGTSDSLTSAQLDDTILNNADVYFGMANRYLHAISSQYAAVNGYDWRKFGLAIAGQNATAYANLYEWRCQLLFDEMRAAGFDLK